MTRRLCSPWCRVGIVSLSGKTSVFFWGLLCFFPADSISGCQFDIGIAVSILQASGSTNLEGKKRKTNKQISHFDLLEWTCVTAQRRCVTAQSPCLTVLTAAACCLSPTSWEPQYPRVLSLLSLPIHLFLLPMLSLSSFPNTPKRICCVSVWDQASLLPTVNLLPSFEFDLLVYRVDNERP